MRISNTIALLVSVGTVVAVVSMGCGAVRNRAIESLDGGDSEDLSPLFPSGEAGTACVGLRCQQKACDGGVVTTLTGKVFAPNGELALYNAIVYVPNAEVQPFVKGATCDTCGSVTGEPIVSALTDATGKFELKNVPAGNDIPLVIQIGKWRRQVVIPEVKECTETELNDRELTRLPKNQTEGDMPQIALTTGQCDNVGCILPKDWHRSIGIWTPKRRREQDGACLQ